MSPEAADPSLEADRPALRKSPTGVAGLDEVTGGGLPRGRPTLVCGGPGSGKTLLAISFLVNGAVRYGEPGVLMSFEESAQDLAADVASLGFDLPRLIDEGRLAIDYVHIERSEIEETGEYDLDGLFVRLDYAIKSIGARRLVLDTIESLFGGLQNENILRAELRRLLRWLKERQITVLLTGERGDGSLTRHGLEEYVSDAVILLDHRVDDQVSTRRIRVVKYRGSHHGTNEYPFLIDREGISVLPVTSMRLRHAVSAERVSTGVPTMDAMLGGRGYFRGATVLVSGTAGTGKTSIAATFANAACARGERCLYLQFEESPEQLVRNMASIGLDLRRWVDAGLLHLHADRPSRFGLETHLAGIHRLVERIDPAIVVIDPVTNLLTVGPQADVRAMLTRVVDFLKVCGVTALFTSLTPGGAELVETETAISSLMDTWISLSAVEVQRRRRRGLCVLKSRGMAHSDEVGELVLTGHGIEVRAPGPATAAGEELT